MAIKEETSGLEQGDVNLSPLRKKYWERNLDKDAREIFEQDCRYFLHQSLSTPVLNVIKRAWGIYIEDTSGRRYMDMHGNGVHNAGFNNPEVIAAVKRQLEEQMTFCPRRYTNAPATALAEKLAEITPEGLEKSLFCPGGSEAVEMALALARQVTGRFKTISFWDSFHGAGFGAAAVGGEAHFKAGFGPLLPGTYHVEFPDYYRNPWGFENRNDVDAECLRQIEMVMKKDPEICAVLGEPISAAPVVPSPDYWQGVKDLCKQHGAMLIFDEIIEGLGRTGKIFASEHFLSPDVLVLGKSLGGGLLPFAGIVTKAEYDVLGHCSIGHYTHEKNALCAAAALAEIEYIIKNDLAGHAAALGEHVVKRLNEFRERSRLVGNVEGRGLHIGIDLVLDKRTKKRAVEEAEIIMYRCMEKGLAFKTINGNMITLRPALIITEEEMDRALDILTETIFDVEQGHRY